MNQRKPGRPIDPFQSKHNHASCIRDAMRHAGERCRADGLRLTPLRRRVLELIWDSHRPATAYQLLDRLRQEKGNAEPPTVYRALDFLLETGLIHRIESLSAYIGCAHPDKDHVSQFMICTRCQLVAELENTRRLDSAVKSLADDLSFQVADRTIEISGLCKRCQ